MPSPKDAQEKPEPKQNRTCFLPRTRCTEQERLEVENNAALAGLSLSEYQRRALLDCLIIRRDNVLETKAIKELSAIGNNLNQLVRKTHINNTADSQKIRETIETIDNLIMGLVCDP
ncbi:MAG: plasmid mobilization relaxosome protein MobC [Methylomarinum sp.]|nr:plasmid mobilization relaxosome protein MobC [Methylomarinum sp.]